MSVLQNVKEKLKNVQDDIKSSFRSLTLNDEQERKKFSQPKFRVQHISSGVNSDAGAELLDRFQTYWSQIHESSEENAKIATDIDENLSTLLLHIEQQSLRFQQLSNELNYIKFINEDIQKLHGSLANLEVCFRTVESDLEQLDDICEEVEFQQNCVQHQEQFKSWQDSRVKELQELKVKISQEHVKKVQAHEQRKLEQLKMRQEAFHDAFMSDMDHYRKLGRVDRTPSPSSENKLDISDIELDQDDQTLDEFLSADGEEEITNVREGSNEIEDLNVLEDEDISPELREEMKVDSTGVEEQKLDSESVTDDADAKADNP